MQQQLFYGFFSETRNKSGETTFVLSLDVSCGYDPNKKSSREEEDEDRERKQTDSVRYETWAKERNGKREYTIQTKGKGSQRNKRKR